MKTLLIILLCLLSGCQKDLYKRIESLEKLVNQHDSLLHQYNIGLDDGVYFDDGIYREIITDTIIPTIKIEQIPLN